MRREEIVKLFERDVLETAAGLFGTSKADLKLYEGYEGCQNLVYDYERDGVPMILRASFRPDRSIDEIKAELHFVNYLADHGVRVSRAVLSEQDNFLETVETASIHFAVVSFVKGPGMRVPDNGYRYRENAPIEEYFQNWGQVLGRMHALAKDYEPVSESVKRPKWHELERFRYIDERVPDTLPTIRQKLKELIAEVQSLPKSNDAYGLVHGDFNDGNFTVDYDTGDITVFDFDDACYCWFVYELACAWQSGVGRTMFEGPAKRQAFMAHYFDQVLEGYHREHSLDNEWLDRLPLFLKLIELEEFLYFVRYINDPDPEMRTYLDYKIACINDDIPYFGFFDTIYSAERPFHLV